MTEPITTNRSLIVPNTGDLPGAWGTSALNPNFQSIDTLFGGVTTISLSVTTTILLSVPATTGIWPGGNPSQSMNALIRFTGAQTGSATIQFTLPGFYIVENKCTGTTFVKLSPASGGGNSIGAPPGKKCHVFYDGTDMDYVDMPDPGTAYDLHQNTQVTPAWITCCSVAPYLVKDGTVYTSSIYPALSALLGSTYGGNGVTTFAVPDERSRMRVMVDTVQPASGATSARVTLAISRISANSMGASGGDQRLQSHGHTSTLTDPGHSHGMALTAGAGGAATGVPEGQLPIVTTATAVISSAITSISINNASAGLGGSQNMPPCIFSILALIKT